MNALAMLVSLLSIHVGHNCGAVDPLRNEGSWTQRGQVYSATYRDTGEAIVWDTKVPTYVNLLATTGHGKKVRIRCGK